MEIAPILLGYIFSTVVGAIFLRIVIDNWFWSYFRKEMQVEGKPSAIFSLPLGIIERLLYTTAIILKFPEWIPVWLGLKVAVSWNRWQNQKERGAYNIFLIGNALSIIFAFAGAWIVLGSLPSLNK